MSSYKFTSIEKVEPNPIIKKIWLFTAIIFIFLVLILFLPWQQTVKGEGVVTAYDPSQRDYQVLSTMDGFIEEFYVSENEFVTKGTKLFKMVDLDKNYLQKLQIIQNATKDKYENSEIQIKNLTRQRDNAKEYSLVGLEVYNQKLSQTKDKIKSLFLKKLALEKNAEITKASYERVGLLYEDGIESKNKLQERENVYVKAKMELENVYVEIEIENKNVNIIKNDKIKFLKESQNKIKSLDNNILIAHNGLKTLQQEIQGQSSNIARYSSGEVMAEKDGHVVRIYQNDKNKYIKKGEEIIYFSPKVSTKSVLLRVSGFNMPLIKEGLQARIMFYGWPALQIAGWPKIKFGTFGGVIKKVESSSYEKGFYYAQIVEDSKEPWPRANALRIGTQANVWIRLDTVPVWYQIWRLMNALPPKMVTPVIADHL